MKDTSNNNGKATLNAETLKMLRSMRTLNILYGMGVQLHRPHVTKAIEAGRLSIEEGNIYDLPGHDSFEQCTVMAFITYRGRRFGPFSMEDFPENAQSTVQAEAFLDLVEIMESERKNP